MSEKDRETRAFKLLRSSLYDYVATTLNYQTKIKSVSSISLADVDVARENVYTAARELTKERNTIHES